MNMLAEKGQSLYSADFSTANITGNAEAVKVFKYLYDLAAEGLQQSPVDPSPNWMGADFNNGQIAILQYGYWFSAMAESDATAGCNSIRTTGRRRSQPPGRSTSGPRSRARSASTRCSRTSRRT